MARWSRVWMVWMCCCAAAMAGVRELPPDAVLVRPEQMSVPAGIDADAERVLNDIRQAKADVALARFEGMVDPLRFELVAARVIEVLQSQPASASGDVVLAALEQAPTRLYRRHEETAADYFEPLIDVAGRAGSARRLHAFLLERDALVAKLKRDPGAVSKGDDAPVIAAAVEQLPVATAQRLAEFALAGKVKLPSQAWAALALREPRADVLEATLQHAEAVDVLPLFDVLLPKLAPDLALHWLQSAARRSDYTSVSVMSLGALAPRSPAAEAALLKHLEDPVTGPSAAAALAMLAVPDRLQRIDAMLAKARSATVVAHLALALRLEGSEAARQRLHQLENDPRLPAATKAELQR